MNLFRDGARPVGSPLRDPEVALALTELALRDQPCALRSITLFTWLRRFIGRPGLADCLCDLQTLMSRPDPIGARLLAAWLEVVSPGHRLMPLVMGFASSRRLTIHLTARPPAKGSHLEAWQTRLRELSDSCASFLREVGVACPTSRDVPGMEAPWPTLRTGLQELQARRDDGGGAMLRYRELMADLLRLETDAWQERLSDLAGRIHPFEPVKVARMLPRLNQADSDIRDLRQFIAWVDEGDFKSAFVRRESRLNTLWEPKEKAGLEKTFKGQAELGELYRQYQECQTRPVALGRLAYAVGRFMALQDHLVAEGMSESPLDLARALEFVQAHHWQGDVAVPLQPGEEEVLVRALDGATARGGWPVTGFAFAAGQLLLDLRAAETAAPWPEDLPTPLGPHPETGGYLLNQPPAPAPLEEVIAAEAEPEEELSEEQAEALSNAHIKNLVMTNLMSVSLLLGFLRNPKVIAIPGLVCDVARRTRNPQIIETIAVDRTLHTGFANREVPRICLMSPCNVSIKILRKFIHVKYVSKVDMKRMAADRAGIRKEVSREIEKYLDALS